MAMVRSQVPQTLRSILYNSTTVVRPIAHGSGTSSCCPHARQISSSAIAWSEQGKARPSATPQEHEPSSSKRNISASQQTAEQPCSSPSTSPPEPKFSTSQSKFAAEQDKLPLPWLDRPLGVATKPSKFKIQATRQERAQAYIDGGRDEERKRIVKSATQGYFHDFHSLRSHGGKTWRAPSTLIRSDRALYFPEIEGTCLADRQRTSTTTLLEGKVSVVALLNSKISEEHTSSFYEPTLDLYKSNKNFQLIQINMQPNLLKNYLISLFFTSLRSQVPTHLHAGYLLSKVNIDSTSSASGTVHRADLNIHNKHVGYVYLVGPDGKIRWAGCGFAEKGERDALLNCTGVLLGRSSGSVL